MTFEKPKRKAKPKSQEAGNQTIKLFAFVLLALLLSIGISLLIFISATKTQEPSLRSLPLPEDNLLADGSFENNPLNGDSIWVVEERGTDLDIEWVEDSGNHLVQLSASQSANQGWPGLITTIDLTEGYDYTFSANMFSPDGASGWLSVDLLDVEGNLLRGYSTGCHESQSEWHTKTYTLKASFYQDMKVSVVRLGLLQCLNFSEGETTTLYIDDVSLMAELPTE